MNELKTAEQWCDSTGIKIKVALGWKATGPDNCYGEGDAQWNTLITRDDFLQRAYNSDCSCWPKPLKDETVMCCVYPNQLDCPVCRRPGGSCETCNPNQSNNVVPHPPKVDRWTVARLRDLLNGLPSDAQIKMSTRAYYGDDKYSRDNYFLDDVDVVFLKDFVTTVYLRGE